MNALSAGRIPSISIASPCLRTRSGGSHDFTATVRSARIVVLGLSFKAGTEDLRESLMVLLIETLIGKGLSLTIFDREVELARLFGSSKEYIEREIPYISSLMRRRVDEVIGSSEVIVVTKRTEEFQAVLEQMAQGPLIIDLARVPEGRCSQESYQGIAW